MKDARIVASALAFLCIGFIGIASAEERGAYASCAKASRCDLSRWDMDSECTGGAALDGKQKTVIRFWVTCPAEHAAAKGLGGATISLHPGPRYSDADHSGWGLRYSKHLRSGDPNLAVASICFMSVRCGIYDPEGLVAGETYTAKGWLTTPRDERCITPVRMEEIGPGPKASISFYRVFYGWPIGCGKPLHLPWP